MPAEFPAQLKILPVHGPVSGRIRPPGSKSITNRALIVAALAQGKSQLEGVLDSRDTEVMVESLRRLGISIHHDLASSTMTVSGCGGQIPVSSADLWLENSGTSIRFLTALCALGNGRFRLDGNTRMRERPIRDLVDGLTQLGTKVTCELGTECPPVVVESQGLKGGLAKIGVNVSSQYLSALLMASPGAASPVELDLATPPVSEPYIDMTLGVMARFGVTVTSTPNGGYHILPQVYRGQNYSIEPDASAASYFFAAAAVTQGTVTVEGLSEFALQGDVRFVELLQQMGCEVSWKENSITVTGKPLNGIDIDMNSISDTAQTLAVVAPFANGPTRIHHIGHVRHKETDRIDAVARELRKLGCQVEEFDDGLTIHPASLRPALIETYDDHRMAMSFSLVGLRIPDVVIDNPACITKTYPAYFEDLSALCGQSIFLPIESQE